MSVTAVVVDNGEINLERSLLSLKPQVDELIVCPGPKSDLTLASKLADRVLEITEGIGKARVKGILEAKGKYIISADSDCIYDGGYVGSAVQDLQLLNAVKAGRVLPLEWNPVSVFEGLMVPWFCYEFGLAFRRDAFLGARIHEADYSDGRSDIGLSVLSRLLPVPDPRMLCWTRLPTHYGDIIMRDYLPSILASSALLGGVAAIPLINEGLKGR